jgi:hypothetical protein
MASSISGFERTGVSKVSTLLLIRRSAFAFVSQASGSRGRVGGIRTLNTLLRGITSGSFTTVRGRTAIIFQMDAFQTAPLLQGRTTSAQNVSPWDLALDATGLSGSSSARLCSLSRNALLDA